MNKTRINVETNSNQAESCRQYPLSADPNGGAASEQSVDLKPDALERPRDLFFRWLTYLVLMPLFVIATSVFGSIALFFSLFDGTGRLQHKVAHRWGGVLTRIALSPVKIIGMENLHGIPVAVYAVNHLSYMDTPVLFSKLPFQFRIVARHELFRLPFIGWYLQRSGQIPVDSTNLRSTLASLNRGVRVLQTGTPLVIFPEGGRSADGKIQPFLSGPAYMAIRAQVPVVPVALVGTYEIMPMHTYHLRPRPLLVVIGSPLPTIGYNSKDADVLTERLHAEISEMYVRHSQLAHQNAAVTAEQSGNVS